MIISNHARKRWAWRFYNTGADIELALKNAKKLPAKLKKLYGIRCRARICGDMIFVIKGNVVVTCIIADHHNTGDRDHRELLYGPITRG